MTEVLYKDATEAQKPAVLAQLRQQFAETAALYDREGRVAEDNFAILHRHGLTGLTIPKARGGLGAGLGESAQVIRAIAGGEPSTALILIMQCIVHNDPDGRDRWPEHLRRQLERDALERGALANALRVEPELGTPARGGLPASIARKVSGGWRVSGHKLFSTGSPVLSYMLVWARTEGDDPQVGYFLVPAGSDGVRIEPTWRHLGMRASGSHDVIFDEVFIAEDHAVDIRAPKAWNEESPILMAWMVGLMGALYDGVAHAARDWFVAFAHNRKPANLGASLSTLYRYQELLGRIEAKLLSNRILLDDLNRRIDAGTFVSASEALLIKYLVSDQVIDAVSIALEATGNPGLTQNNDLERHYRDVLCSRAHAPQNDSILTLAGRTGFAAYPKDLS
ncbi:MAG: acyl-CoA dehydrogenase family protein [Asticcacaulis sp.]